MTADGIRWLALEEQFGRVGELVDRIDALVGLARRAAVDGNLARRDATDIAAEAEQLVKDASYFQDCVVDSLDAMGGTRQ